jgi:hypothetical protein
MICPLGYVWIDGIKGSGIEQNKMEWSGTERYETNTSFHCLGILFLS